MGTFGCCTVAHNGPVNFYVNLGVKTCNVSLSKRAFCPIAKFCGCLKCQVSIFAGLWRVFVLCY